MSNRTQGRELVTGQGSTGDTVLSTLATFGQELSTIKQVVTEMHQILLHQTIEKEWYSSAELAEAMKVSVYTIAERWCNGGRIECEKDPDTGKWRIPGHEYRRLVMGGALRPRTKVHPSS